MPDFECFFIVGRSYVTGAHAIVKSKELRSLHSNDIRFVIPCMMLLGHALEVYLKAWLSFKGYPNSKLQKKPFGHDLRKLYEQAKIESLPEPVLPAQCSIHDLVETFEEDHGDYSFRYPNENWTFEVPICSIAFRIFAELDKAIGDAIGGEPQDLFDWAVESAEDFRLIPNT